MKRHFLLAILFALLTIPPGYSTCVIYFTGIGCPHCAKTDPLIFKQLLKEYNLTIIEYEIYQNGENGAVMYKYDEKYHTSLYIPLVIFDAGNYILGDKPILESIRARLDEVKDNKCLLLDGYAYPEELDFGSLPGRPKIWVSDRAIVKGSSYLSTEIVRDLLFSRNLTEVLKGLVNVSKENKCITYSGGEVCFDNEIKINDWEFFWNGPSFTFNYTNRGIHSSQPIALELTLGKIISLATVDAVNPCALAVLTFILIAITTYSPKKRHKVLLTGFSFSFSIFLVYFLYGLVIIKFFQFLTQLTLLKSYIYKGLACFAVILGLLNLKDFLSYKPGGLLTEMPLPWRPKVKKITEKVTSPAGAALIGVFVTLFLLPCTMGPYIIAGGILSVLELVRTLPWLLLYNLIFVLPMLCITIVVYLGYRTVEKVSGWKEKNIRYLHLVAGLIMLSLGVCMAFGLV